jgi:hypothetical protein
MHHMGQLTILKALLGYHNIPQQCEISAKNLPLGKELQEPIGQETGCAPGLV